MNIKTKKEVISDLFFELAPLINDSCNRSRVYLLVKVSGEEITDQSKLNIEA
ncbi:hypothetical protein M3O96_02520 [Aquiflexum sp. TKW24L]|uniref:hypothetical protein n=1 Tax=Aquiflexum sp. TKW24L TaxID=2942212 RepID=UPI0020BF5ECF|nr:hypothetical protein [Aquiflexum sp. TKW24L]MCL6257947.1 hypothetical protein [Aquiflexum sp. TKW24L]